MPYIPTFVPYTDDDVFLGFFRGSGEYREAD